MQRRRIEVDKHALKRMLIRGLKFGLNLDETKRRMFHTIVNDAQAKRKHKSMTNITYYHYFHDNLAFYVVCSRREFRDEAPLRVRTVIIERGRE